MVQIDDDYYEDLTEKDMHEIIDELKVVYSEYFSDSFLLTWNTVSHFFLLLHKHLFTTFSQTFLSENHPWGIGEVAAAGSPF